jgi:hypothetical protein
VTRKTNPNKAKNALVTAPLAAVNRRLVNSLTSSIGWAVRTSCSTKTPRTTAAAMNPTIVRVDAQPRSGASMMV